MSTPASYEDRLLTRGQMLSLMDMALAGGRSFSLARFGHGEIIDIAGPLFPQLEAAMAPLKGYRGAVTDPDRLRALEIQALKTADVAGLLTSAESGEWARWTDQVLEDLAVRPSLVCSAFVTHHLVRRPSFWAWLRHVPVILVGRRARQGVAPFLRQGIRVVGWLPLEGMDPLPLAYDRLRRDARWRVALVSAGAPATILAPRLARASGRIVLDFGHALDLVIDGEGFDFGTLVQQWGARRPLVSRWEEGDTHW